jgi:hypothetical protein
MNVYKQIRNGIILDETDDDFQRSLLNQDVFERDFFAKGSMDFEIIQQKPSFTIYRLGVLTAKFNIIFYKVKNSGIRHNNNKRLQVYRGTNFDNQSGPYFGVGIYNTGDKVIYIITDDISAFIGNAILGKTYSSFWIEFDKIVEVYASGFEYYYDTSNRKISLMTNEYLNSLSVKDIFTNFFGVDIVMHYPHTYYQPAEHLISVHDQKLVRNRLFVEQAFVRENRTCELCGTLETFEISNNRMYFEGHHAIPYNRTVQAGFSKLLDHPDNIICLCPKCHKEIHFSLSERKKQLINSIFQKHMNLIADYEIENIESIYQYYMNEVSDYEYD